MKCSGSGRIGGAGLCPTVGRGIVSPARVDIVAVERKWNVVQDLCEIDEARTIVDVVAGFVGAVELGPTLNRALTGIAPGAGFLVQPDLWVLDVVVPADKGAGFQVRPHVEFDRLIKQIFRESAGRAINPAADHKLIHVRPDGPGHKFKSQAAKGSVV